MTASNLSRAPAQLSEAQQAIANCRPMAHQNSGDHGHEMHPQQLVRLVGCHDPHAAQDLARDLAGPPSQAKLEKLH